MEILNDAAGKRAEAVSRAAYDGKGGIRMKERADPARPGKECILPRQVCECWKRRQIRPVDVRECWYCRYADFGWQKEFADEVGKCCYPNPRL